MCGGGPPKPKPPPPPVQPPVQPPPIAEAAPEVAVGNQSKSEAKRRKVGRSALKQAPASSGGASSSGLGS
jgi:hypothetical protein